MTVGRLALLDRLLPHCEPDTASVMYPKGKDEGPGWVHGRADVERAIAAYRAGTLSGQKFASVTQDGRRYTIAGGTRLGLVPHRYGLNELARFREAGETCHPERSEGSLPNLAEILRCAQNDFVLEPHRIA